MNTQKRTHLITNAFTFIQSFIVKSALLFALLLSLTSCGNGGGGAGSTSGVTSNQNPADANYFTVTSDDYGLMTPNFYYSTNNSTVWSIQADVANDVWDQNFRSIIRIDIPKSGNNDMPAINKSFSIENDGQYEKFPGTFYVFNGHTSVLKKVEQGTVVFTSDSVPSGTVSGVYNVILTDYDSAILPPPQYHLNGTFRFKMGAYGSAVPLPAEVYPERGRTAYDQLCSSCHFLGSYDPIPKSASNLSQRGGELPTIYPGAVPEHQGITLDAPTMQDLRVFLNAG